MTSYFEKLTSLNASSLKFQSTPDLSSALEKLDELKKLNTQLELDLKCEHDEKSDLVSLKVGLENRILELTEVNETLVYQVEQLKDEKDKIHHVLAKMKEDGDERNKHLFIAGSGVMKKFPSLDDLSLPSSPTDSNRATTCTSPTSNASYGRSLERIDEIDETLLESLVTNETLKPVPPTLEQLMKRIAFLESENELLRRGCPKCRGQHKQPNPVIFEHDDEGLVLSAVEEDDEFENQDSDATCIRNIVEMQQKIIRKLENEVFQMGEHGNVHQEVCRLKQELQARMGRIARRVGLSGGGSEQGDLGAHGGAD